MNDHPGNRTVSDTRARRARGILERIRSRVQQAVSCFRGRLQRGIRYVVGEDGWAARIVGEAILDHGGKMGADVPRSLVSSAAGLYYQVVHFGSLWDLRRDIECTHRSNRLVATVFHGDPSMGSEMAEAFDVLRRSTARLSAVVTACNTMGRRLLILGVPERKLHVIPLGVNLDVFQPPTPAQRAAQRRRLSVPEDCVCIGSFQKDGAGSGEGLEPKMIKGPDVFLEVVTRLARRRRVFVLLTGPARGYVKRRLEKAGIPYQHEFLARYDELAAWYHCLDLYIVASREEGGPKAVLESMAAGVPLISTRVGMAPEVVADGVNGLLADVEDATALATAAARVIDDRNLGQLLVREGLKTVRAYDWSLVARAYHREVYAPLLDAGRSRSRDAHSVAPTRETGDWQWPR